MTGSQQEQTFRYFQDVAGDWQREAQGEAPRHNIIAERNGAVLRAAAAYGSQNSVDLGCGTGELVVELALSGLSATGVDFSPAMIGYCERLKEDRAVDRARFIKQSIFDFAAAPGSLDLVSGLGLIEYISSAQLDEIIARSKTWLRSGGVLALGSRNRLFNLHSLNEYTTLELDLGTVPALLAEAVALASESQLAAALTESGTGELAQPDRHPDTGIGVETRFQYTPGELTRRFANAGFVVADLAPVHFHGFPVGLKAVAPDLHQQLAQVSLPTLMWSHRLVPYSSSFVITAIAT